MDEAREAVDHWNETQSLVVPWRIVEKALNAFSAWQDAIAISAPPSDVTAHLQCHNDWCRCIPDELMLQLMDDDYEAIQYN